MIRGYPINKGNQVIGRPYQGTHTLGNWQSDRAMDFAGNGGSPIYAIANGRINGWPHGKSIRKATSGGNIFGWNIYLQEYRGEDWHPPYKWNGATLRKIWKPTNTFWFYTHIRHVKVIEGQYVRRGQIIAIGVEENCLHIGCNRFSPEGIFNLKLRMRKDQRKRCPRGSCRP